MTATPLEPDRAFDELQLKALSLFAQGESDGKIALALADQLPGVTRNVIIGWRQRIKKADRKAHGEKVKD
ncbi:MAG: hypothetical protein AB7O04_07375 [Hyphomonadaceae bacterium]